MNRAEAWITIAAWAGLGFLAGAWAMLMPGGVPVSHSRFWMNPAPDRRFSICGRLATQTRPSALPHTRRVPSLENAGVEVDTGVSIPSETAGSSPGPS